MICSLIFRSTSTSFLIRSLALQLNPPPAQALTVLHKLASDPGIVAIMKTV